MNDETLMELHSHLKDVEKKDASYVAGFICVFNIIKKRFADNGTPVQNALLDYMEKELSSLYTIKSEHGRFKHIIK